MGLPPSIALKQGYVEPNPFIFGRLASLANFMIQGLKSRNLLYEKFQVALENFSQLTVNLKTIAEKELTQTQINLDIINLRGQTVRNLWNGIQSQGEHIIDWDGRDNYGNSLPSGVYLVQLRSEEIAFTQKITLIR